MRLGTWISDKVEAGIEATPWWVFVLGPRWLGILLVAGLLFYGLHALTGTSLNPVENFRAITAQLGQH